ncbi:oxygenase [Lithospermum erythrorhizon]|uniref:Oxygenase n=1 Tax=Lithospermum erythrorhizon TaxID=34254 RepID=A0AAV3Q767_LITER
MKETISEKVGDVWESYMNRFGQGMHLQLISEEIDPVTGSGKMFETSVHSWSEPSEHPYAVEHELHLVDIVFHGFKDDLIRFPANTWIHSQKDNPESRIIFKNQAYLPSETPLGIKDLRCEDLLSFRGSGKHERIYDYDVYNDLGNPDKGEDFVRKLLGGEKRPYPRRCRTGRPPTRKDPFFETRIEPPNQFYVPRDENFEEVKQKSFSSSRLKGLLHS